MAAMPAFARHAPNLMRLLAPGESLLYTARLHPLYGWWFGVLAALCLGLSYIWPWTLLGTVVFSVLYLVPFYKNEIAVTTHRLLLRVGRFQLVTEDFTSEQILNWHIHQTIVDNILNAGTVLIDVREGTTVRRVVLARVRSPLTFVQALETLNPALRNLTTHAAA